MIVGVPGEIGEGAGAHFSGLGLDLNRLHNWMKFLAKGR